jgi:AraC-like DNA-binding protein
MERGREAFECNGQSWIAPVGSLIIINPGDAHDGRGVDAEPWSYFALYPTVELLTEVARETRVGSGVAPDFRKAVVQDANLQTALVAAASVFEQDGALACESRLFRALCRLVRRHASGKRRDLDRDLLDSRVADRAAEIIHAHWADDVSLSDLAQRVGSGRFRLLRSFERKFGLPPHAFQLNVRVRRAQALLASGTSAAEVAAETGFCDQSHFTRRFRAVVGVSPGIYAGAIAASRREQRRVG